MRTAVALVLALSLPAIAEELRGQVVSYGEGTVEIVVEHGHVHQDAQVEVYIQLPDLEDTAWVCTGKVARVEGNHVFATVTERSADPREGDLAKITGTH